MVLPHSGWTSGNVGARDPPGRGHLEAAGYGLHASHILGEGSLFMTAVSSVQGRLLCLLLVQIFIIICLNKGQKESHKKHILKRKKE